jgi:hypothetical protein
MKAKKFEVLAIHRAHSSGYETKMKEFFSSLEEASEWIQKYILKLCDESGWPHTWDSDDMYGMNSPTPSLASMSRLALLLAKSKKGEQVLVWGPESRFEVQRPNEIFLLRNE